MPRPTRRDRNRLALLLDQRAASTDRSGRIDHRRVHSSGQHDRHALVYLARGPAARARQDGASQGRFGIARVFHRDMSRDEAERRRLAREVSGLIDLHDSPVARSTRISCAILPPSAGRGNARSESASRHMPSGASRPSR